MTKVSIIIVNYNVRTFLIQCIESILKSDFDVNNLEIIVVDNNSIDGSVEYLNKHFPNIITIPNKFNQGFSVANNQGISIATGDYILILNPDTLIQENTLRECLRCMDKNPQCGVMGVKMIDGSGTYLPESKRGEPTLWNSFTKFSGLTALFPKSKWLSGYYLGHLNENDANEIDVLCGAFMFFRADVLRKCEGFDEDYFMYGEDIDLSRKVAKLKHKILYWPHTKIIHFKGESTKKASFNYVINFYTAMKIFVRKNYHGVHGFVLRQILNLTILLAGVVAYLKNIVVKHVRLILDAGFIFIGTQILKQWWAAFHFNDVLYFKNAASYYNNSGITLIYVFFLWFFGQYENNWKIKRQIFAVVCGFIVSMIVYALLPLHLRSSRIILLISGVLALIIPGCTKWMFEKVSQFFNASKDAKYLIVGQKDNAKKIESLILNNDAKAEILGFIDPSNEQQTIDDFFINSIKNLTLVAKTMKANKIVFCSDDIDNQTILDIMILPDTQINYLITSVNRNSIVDSNDKNISGYIYSTQSSYKLSQNIYLRLKRAIDVLVALFSLLLFPIGIWFISFRNYIYPNVLSLLSGHKSMVGYSIETKIGMLDNDLPIVKNGVLTTDKLINNTKYFPLIKNGTEADAFYAKNYSPILDMEIIIKNLF